MVFLLSCMVEKVHLHFLSLALDCRLQRWTRWRNHLTSVLHIHSVRHSLSKRHRLLSNYIWKGFSARENEGAVNAKCRINQHSSSLCLIAYRHSSWVFKVTVISWCCSKLGHLKSHFHISEYSGCTGIKIQEQQKCFQKRHFLVSQTVIS